MSETVSPLELPHLLADQQQKNLSHFYERCPEYQLWLQSQLSDSIFTQQLATTWVCSRFAFEQCLSRPQAFKQMIEQGDHLHSYAADEMARRLKSALSAVEDKEQLDRALRQFRNREMLRIIWRDFNRLADMVETTTNVSYLADSCIEQALAFHHRQMVERHGEPCSQYQGESMPQQLLVLGMGKLGAYELNLSSDIDLIFCYPSNGETKVGETKAGETIAEGSDNKKIIDNHSFFTRLGQRLIASLDAMTADGFVFRVDMRLRPYGESGPLVQSFTAMEEYYQDQGREWERYAMIKARVVAGSPEQSEQLMALLRPFTYRRYIDFSAIDSLRAMKKMIQQELLRRQLGSDVKLGSGGIREVEFIVQSFQLIRGGRERELQDRSLLAVLQHLAQKEYLPGAVVSQLQEAYVFLRNAEHAIQGYQDRQTQLLPTDDWPRCALAYVMGFESWAAFEAGLQLHRDAVAGHFAEVISDKKELHERSSADLRWQGLWLDDNDPAAAQTILEQAGHEQAAVIVERLRQLTASHTVLRMQAIGRERLDDFMPLLLESVAEAEYPSEVFLRIFPLVESVLRRTAYLLLLVENQSAFKELVVLCEASPWISTQLARHPVLLDELLNATSLYHVPKKTALRDDLQQQVLRLPMNDLEAHMETLRYFRLSHVLKVAACEVSGRLPLMKVSDYLTWIAEVILEHVLAVAWHDLEEKHGNPQESVGVPCERRFIIVGYGKLGGIELGHGSDLDLVFIHDVPNNQVTDGPRPIDNSSFFTRLGQRMIHILTAQTQLGPLYEADMRLRPSGASGMLTTSLNAFEDYQQNKAWVWEHQALVRARVVAGNADLAKDFEAVREKILAKPRDQKDLKQEVVSMRKKMRDHLLPKEANQAESTLFPVKQGLGGIVDIEFMVQYAVLEWSGQHPLLATYTDNIRILEVLQQEQLFSEQEVQQLSEAYKLYRSHAHRLSLQEREVAIAHEQVAEYRAAVQHKWQQLFDHALDARC